MNSVRVMQHNSGLEFSPKISQFRGVLLNWVIGLFTLVVPGVQASADIIQNGDVFITGDGRQIVAENANGDLEVNGGDELITGALLVATGPTVVGSVLVTDPGSAIRLTGSTNRLGKGNNVTNCNNPTRRPWLRAMTTARWAERATDP
jgi:hypothetical protein